jgi:hypothetical protein
MRDEDTRGRTTFARATREYDSEFERAITKRFRESSFNGGDVAGRA